jgi:hypothetical protein
MKAMARKLYADDDERGDEKAIESIGVVRKMLEKPHLVGHHS